MKPQKYEPLFSQMTVEKAYLLGFLATDGYCGSSVVSIELQGQDHPLLESLMPVFKSSGYRPSLTQTVKKGRLYSRLRVHSVQLVQELATLGITRRKSLTISVHMDSFGVYLVDYIRGVIDGDGSITVRRNDVEVSLCSASSEFIRDINSLLPMFGIAPKNIGTRVRSRKNPLYRFSVYSIDARSLLQQLYYPECLALPRKKLVAQSFKPTKKWSQSDVQYLREKADTLTAHQIADHLGKTYASVRSKGYRLGMKV
jgi:intein/homing endonuclease